MQALRETTGGAFPAHTYLLNGSTLVAYIKSGDTAPFYFKNGIKGFDRRGRKFEVVVSDQFNVTSVAASAAVAASTVVEVAGSKGAVYQVDTALGTCSCPGYTYRGSCRHIQLAAEQPVAA